MPPASEIEPDIATESFPARLTASALVGTLRTFSWVEQERDPETNAWVDMQFGRFGDGSCHPAYEWNTNDATVGTQVAMMYMTALGTVDAYVFDGPGAAAAGGGTLTVAEVDGVPTYTAVNTLRFDQADGFVLSQPATGVARVDINATTYGTDPTGTQALVGVVSTGTQTMKGKKFLESLVVGNNSSALPSSFEFYGGGSGIGNNCHFFLGTCAVGPNVPQSGAPWAMLDGYTTADGP